MLYIVDGTGPFLNDSYVAAMAGSHCTVLYQMNKRSAHYWRGPDTFSVWDNVTDTAEKVLKQITASEFGQPRLVAPGDRASTRVPATPVYLVGYSRGGATVIKVAKALAQRDVEVAGMFLFDAVDRTVFAGNAETVPGNVRKCYHAIRNDGAAIVMEHEVRQLWRKCEQTPGFDEAYAKFTRTGSGRFPDFLSVHASSLSKRDLSQAVAAWKPREETLQRLRMAMRNSFGVSSSTAGPELSIPFGNCGRKHADAARYIEQEFAGTHAALGGVPWTTLGEEIATMDRAVSRRVWSWMSGKMRECGLRAFDNA